MNILMISDVYFPRINGVSTSIETFRQELDLLQVRSTLIAPAYPQGAEANHPAIVSIPSRFLPLDPEDRMMRRSAIRQWVRTQMKERYDLVHIHTPFVAHYAGLEIAHALGIPVIASYHTYFEEYLHHYVPVLPRRSTRAIARRFSRQQCNALDAVIVPSRAMAETLAGYGVTRPMHILPTGLREERFTDGDGEAFRKRHDIPQDRPLLLFVGRVAFEKNIGFLLEVTDHMRVAKPDILLLITGEGPALDGLRKKAHAMGLDNHVRFLGYLDRRHALADCYCAANLFVFASQTETQGLVLLEAMALGCPVLAQAVMGTRDILENTPGAFVAEETAKDFARQAVELLHDHQALRNAGAQARGSARKWSAAEMAHRLRDIYAGLASRTTSPQ